MNGNLEEDKDPEIASDIDPALIVDPILRQLHILKQRMKKAQKNTRLYASLKRIESKDISGNKNFMKKMVDVTDVL